MVREKNVNKVVINASDHYKYQQKQRLIFLGYNMQLITVSMLTHRATLFLYLTNAKHDDVLHFMKESGMYVWNDSSA